MLTEQRLLRANELAHALNMGLGSIYRLAKAGSIPSYSAGPGLSGVRFDLGEVKRVLQRPVRKQAEESPCVGVN